VNVAGEFTTATPIAGLRALGAKPDVLERVSTLRDVRTGAGGVVHAVFTPSISLGQIPLATTITTLEEDETGARLRVVGRRGTQLVDVDLRMDFKSTTDGVTVVNWNAGLIVRGNAASVGQRVARDITMRAIASVLAEAAQVAGSAVSDAHL